MEHPRHVFLRGGESPDQHMSLDHMTALALVQKNIDDINRPYVEAIQVKLHQLVQVGRIPRDVLEPPEPRRWLANSRQPSTDLERWHTVEWEWVPDGRVTHRMSLTLSKKPNATLQDITFRCEHCAFRHTSHAITIVLHGDHVTDVSAEDIPLHADHIAALSAATEQRAYNGQVNKYHLRISTYPPGVHMSIGGAYHFSFYPSIGLFHADGEPDAGKGNLSTAWVYEVLTAMLTLVPTTQLT